VRFVEHCFLAWEVFHRTTSPSLKVWVRTLNKRAGLPHRATCVKIMRILRTLVETKLHEIIKEHAKLRITPHYNYKYDWLRPEEIVAAYLRLYGKELRD
jgi:hypothetical protein